jgi:hypothetical protein
MPLKVRYGLLLPLALGFMGASQLFLAWSMSLNGRNVTINLIVGIGGLGLALLVNRAPYFIVDTQALTLNGVGGFLSRKYNYISLADLRLENNRLSYYDGTQWKKLSVSKSIANGDDWKALEALLQQSVPPIMQDK